MNNNPKVNDAAFSRRTRLYRPYSTRPQHTQAFVVDALPPIAVLSEAAANRSTYLPTFVHLCNCFVMQIRPTTLATAQTADTVYSRRSLGSQNII